MRVDLRPCIVLRAFVLRVVLVRVPVVVALVVVVFVMDVAMFVTTMMMPVVVREERLRGGEGLCGEDELRSVWDREGEVPLCLFRLVELCVGIPLRCVQPQEGDEERRKDVLHGCKQRPT